MKKVTIIIIALISIVFTGCEDELLELTPISENTTDNFYKSESDFNSALNAAYNGLQGLNDIGWKMKEVRSDNAWTKRPDGGFDIDNFQLATSNVFIAEYWEIAYNAIFMSNIILDKIADADITEERISQIIGEAKFIRALVYFDLVRFFGDVPLVTNVLKLSESFDVPRAPKADVYTQIIADLIDATSLSSSNENNADKGRVTSAAAYGLLGKVYLTIGDFGKANDALDIVISNPNYDLLPTFEEVFSVENENGLEDVFSIQYSNGTGNGNGFNYLYGPKVEGADILVGVGQATIRPTAELMRVFEDGDTRKMKTYSPYTVNPINSDTITDAYFRKFLSTDLLRDGGQNWPVLRYADILLMKAEVLNEQNDLPGAIDQLNLVRSRAFDGDTDKLYKLIDVSDKGAMKDIILNERRLEFAAENQRWFDLLRFDKAEEFLQKEIRTEDWSTGVDLQTHKGEMKPHQNLYPIPIQEIERSGISQNPGY
jgi:hypothetical protein